MGLGQHGLGWAHAVQDAVDVLAAHPVAMAEDRQRGFACGIGPANLLDVFRPEFAVDGVRHWLPYLAARIAPVT